MENKSDKRSKRGVSPSLDKESIAFDVEISQGNHTPIETFGDVDLG